MVNCFRNFLQIVGSLGCGIGYGYLHRIPIRLLPDEKTATNKPFLGTAPAPISLPYVPPLANTFASTNVNTIPMVPNTGKSDAEIVFSGVSNLNLNANAQAPINAGANETPHQQMQQPLAQPNESTQLLAGQQQTIEIASAATEQSAPLINTSLPPTNYQHTPVFATVPPTSIPSLNESFNIPPSINPSSIPTSVYQTNPMQGKTI